MQFLKKLGAMTDYMRLVCWAIVKTAITVGMYYVGISVLIRNQPFFVISFLQPIFVLFTLFIFIVVSLYDFGPEGGAHRLKFRWKALMFMLETAGVCGAMKFNGWSAVAVVLACCVAMFVLGKFGRVRANKPTTQPTELTV